MKSATRDQVISGFDFFGAATDGDICLLYYSGHGSRVESLEGMTALAPNGVLHSMVCHDSRAEGGMDLVDKELSYLIWKTVEGKDVHFVSIMDCCYAKTNTRWYEDNGILVQDRMHGHRHGIRPLEKFLGHEHLQYRQP